MALLAVRPTTRQLLRSYDKSVGSVLLTNASEIALVPAEVSKAVSRVLRSATANLWDEELPAGASHALIWFAEERLRQGTAGQLRGLFLNSENCSYLPVHLPFRSDLELICLQPRVIPRHHKADQIAHHIRINGSVDPSTAYQRALERADKPWARLHQALLHAVQNPSLGAQKLRGLWKSGKLPLHLASLAARNLIVVLIAMQELKDARKLLELAMEAYPGYSDLSYLYAYLMYLRREDKCIPGFLRKAAGKFSAQYITSGGEFTYKASYLMAASAARMGKYKAELYLYRSGLVADPPYLPSLLAVLQTRRGFNEAYVLQTTELCTIARRYPEYREAIIYFLLLHRQLAAVRRLLPLVEETNPHSTAIAVQLAKAEAAVRPRPLAPGEKPGVLFTAPFRASHGSTRLHCELANALLQDGDLEACLEPDEPEFVTTRPLPYGEAISKGMLRQCSHLDVTICHRWPPDFQPAPCGKLINLLEWKHNVIPRHWKRAIEQNVDEVWVPSEFARQAFISADLDPDKVIRIPKLVPASIFCPEGHTASIPEAKGFTFLSSAISMMDGVDILLKAYFTAFSSRDGVSLILKGTGFESPAVLKRLHRTILRFKKDPSLPDVLLVLKELLDPTYAALIRGSSAVVLPYRAKSFALPVAEAMACGKPVIVTGAGPVLDYACENTACLLPAVQVEVPRPQPPFGPMTGPLLWFEPSVEALAQAMRRVYEHPADASAMGMRAAVEIRRRLNTEEVIRGCVNRVRSLAGVLP
jgi:glycosyltransferase involved in cell wall biosynthesis